MLSGHIFELNPRREFVATALGATALSAAAKPYRIIDPHVHVWKRDDPRFPFAKETSHPPNRDALPETLLEHMKKNGLARPVIIQVIHFRYDESYLLSVLKQYPQFAQGVADVEP